MLTRICSPCRKPESCMERAAQAKEALALFEQEKLDRIAAAMLEAAPGKAFPAGPAVGGRDRLRELAG